MSRVVFAAVVAAVACGGVAACSGSSSTGLFGAPSCADATCSETDSQDPGGGERQPDGAPLPGKSDGGGPRDGSVGAADASGPDGAVFGPCRRDTECATGLCNWEIERCANPGPIGFACRRDTECASHLCNWETEKCSVPAPSGSACRRDSECAGALCNWELEQCQAPQAAGGACRRDTECASGLCNTATDSCQ